MVSTTTPQAPVYRIQAPAPKRWWANLVGAAALASVIIVVALWLSNDGLRNADGPGGVATTVGRLTGLVAADLLLLQVLMMARIPWVERSYGQDLLARRHRWFGFTSFWLMLAHVLLITIGYAQQDRAGVLGEGWTLITTYPGMLLATAGTVLLIAVVGLSIRAARRRLRYESWHLLHLYAYLGVGLALPHEIWTGADFTASALARAYWWTVYAAALGAVIGFRIGLPLWRSWYHRLEVQAVVPEGPGTVSVYLRGRRLDRLPVRAGQFFLWRFLTGPGWTRAHPYTLSAVPRTDRLRITVKNLGDGSARVARLRPGTRVLIEGPLGAMTSANRQRRRVLLMAAGVGITTIRALLEDLDLRYGEATVVYRISRPDDAVFRHELDELGRLRGARIVYLEGRRGHHGSWLPANLGRMSNVDGLRWLVPDVADHEAYLCGPPSWMDTVRTALVAAGVPEDHIHVEMFGW